MPLTYTVTVTNSGPDAEPAAGVTVVDLLRGAVFVSSSLSPMAATPGSLTYALGGLAAGRLAIGDGRGRADGPWPAVQRGGRHGPRPRPEPVEQPRRGLRHRPSRSSTVVSLVRLELPRRADRALALRFAAPLDAATAVNVHNYQLFQLLEGRPLGGDPDRVGGLRPGEPDGDADAMPALPVRALISSWSTGRASTGVSDVFGNLLDGRRHGPASEATTSARVFGQEILVGFSRRRHGPWGHAAFHGAPSTPPGRSSPPIRGGRSQAGGPSRRGRIDVGMVARSGLRAIDFGMADRRV